VIYDRKKVRLATKWDKAIEILYTWIIIEDIVGQSELNKLGGRLCGFAELTELLQKYPSTTAAPFECPVAGYSQQYKRWDKLHRHIRKKRGLKHKFAKEIIDRGYCLQCERYFRDGK
jgi:hypothetical protein